MMMAHDSSAGRPQLGADAVNELTAALQRYAAGEDDAAIQPALRAIARDARERKVHAEQILVLLKEIWYGLPGLREASDTERQHQLLQRIVTICIREYYSP